jgi:hypothetical protein
MVADVRPNWVYTEPNPGEANNKNEAAEVTLKLKEENRSRIFKIEIKIKIVFKPASFHQVAHRLVLGD